GVGAGLPRRDPGGGRPHRRPAQEAGRRGRAAHVHRDGPRRGLPLQGGLMRLFTRILLSHLLVVLVVSVSLIVLAGVVSPFFYRDHVELLVEPTEDGIALRQQLSYGHQRTMVRAFLSSLPLALLLAAATAYLEARR